MLSDYVCKESVDSAVEGTGGGRAARKRADAAGGETRRFRKPALLRPHSIGLTSVRTLWY